MTEDRASCDKARVVHLVPRDGLGGVEAAVRSLRADEHPDLIVLFMAQRMILPASRLHRASTPAHDLGSPLIYWRALREVLRLNPEVLVCSLWRATFIGLLAKLVRPRTKLVVMIHATTFGHKLDRLVTWLGSKMATELWCDSLASSEVAERRYRRSTRTISFRVAAESDESRAGRNPLDFVYWGRHVHFKNVPRAVRIFNRVLHKAPAARLYIYGQEGPATKSIREAIRESPAPGAIQLMGAKPPGTYPSPIPGCTFFLMTSSQEGMAVAVVEAMQLGLIPVVTPVGEIANYCADGINAIIVRDDDQAAASVLKVLEDATLRGRLSAAAQAHWDNVPDYSTDFGNAYLSLLKELRR
jgi:glycosyltransferase involved in cell wall biosynthesis